MKLKKILSTIFALILTIQTAAYAMKFPDVSDSRYVTALDTLSELGIMIGDDNGNFRPNDTIRRSEFAAVSTRLAGIDKQATDQNKPSFPDVPATHWAVGYINLAVSKKYLIGDLAGTFRPDDTLSFQESATILVRVTGHESDAQDAGGYPEGYLTVAKNLGIFEGLEEAIVNNPKAPVSRANVSLCAWNSLSVGK